MSDWGRVVFYYDYEADHEAHNKEKNRVRGLISKAYKYPGADEMILHAYNGIRFFLKHKDIGAYSGMRFDGNRFDDHYSGMAELNQAFDTFFGCGHISLGYSNVERVINDTSLEDEKDIGYHLYSCEGMYGWLYMCFTGSFEAGYKLKYGYKYGYIDEEWDIVDFEKALDVYRDKHKISPRDLCERELLDDAINYFKENAVLMSKDEFLETEALGIDWVCDMRKRDKNPGA